MRKSFAALAVVLLVASSGTSGQQAPAFTPYGVFPVLETYLESLRQQTGIPGMSAAVVRDGAILWERGFGFENVTSRIRATPDTPYLVGDMSGTLAAILLLQCVEQRHLDLDAPIRAYGAALPEADATMRQVLSHTSAEAPAEPFTYSLDRYAQLTPVVETCIPQPYRKSLSHRVLNRLAMRDSVPGTDWLDPAFELPEGLYAEDDVDRYRRVLERLAVPYKVVGRTRVERTELPFMAPSAVGGLVTTVRDLAKLDAALDTDLLLLAETRAAAWSQATGRRGVPVPMGLGWFVQTYKTDRLVWHFGIVPNGYSSLVLKVPSRNLTFILLANGDGLSGPYQLNAGDVTRSPFAALFLRLTT
jgi:CubicO group peptidase (beta-lactamase class C family)